MAIRKYTYKIVDGLLDSLIVSCESMETALKRKSSIDVYKRLQEEIIAFCEERIDDLENPDNAL